MKPMRKLIWAIVIMVAIIGAAVWGFVARPLSLLQRADFGADEARRCKEPISHRFGPPHPLLRVGSRDRCAGGARARTGRAQRRLAQPRALSCPLRLPCLHARPPRVWAQRQTVRFLLLHFRRSQRGAWIHECPGADAGRSRRVVDGRMDRAKFRDSPSGARAQADALRQCRAVRKAHVEHGPVSRPFPRWNSTNWMRS